MKKIILTGGGTAGHVTPNLALIPSLKDHGFEIRYIGSYEGIEKKLITDAGIPYDGISSGKLRRYFDLKNFSDPFRVYHHVCGRKRRYDEPHGKPERCAGEYRYAGYPLRYRNAEGAHP